MQATTFDADSSFAREAELVKKYDSTGDDPDEDDDDENEGQRTSRCFPFELFKPCEHCLPPTCFVMLPAHFRRVQNLPHLMLIIGSIASIGLVVDTVVSWFLVSGACRSPFCLGRILPFVFVSCCLMYFIKTIQQYDEDLSKKQREIVRAKRQLSKRYQEIIGELDECVKNSMDTQATLAERNFESKRRDFQRFCHKISKDFKNHKPGESPEARQQFEQFREFVKNSMRVFAECSIDPVRKPFVIVKEEALDKCESVKQVAELCSDRLKEIKMRIIAGQQEKDKEDLSGFKFVWNRMTAAHDTKLNARRRTTAKQICTGNVMSDMEQAQATFAAQSATSSREIVDAIDKRWFQVGGTPSCCACTADQADDDGFPRELHLCRIKIVFLSQEHVKLMIGFVVGLIVLFIEIFLVDSTKHGTKYALEAEVSVSLVCIAFVLYEFIELDIVQQLDRQLKEVEVEQKRLDEKRTAMLAFYQSTQHLADVWLHRTTPRLELIKQFTEGIEDMPARNFGEFCTQVNIQLKDLRDSLPGLEDWFDDKTMDTDKMKVFGDSMNELTRTYSIEETLQKMPQCCKILSAETARIKALPPAGPAPAEPSKVV